VAHKSLPLITENPPKISAIQHDYIFVCL